MQIIRPARGPETVATELRSRAEQLTDELATLAQDVLKSYTPNRWKGLLYRAVGNRGPIPGGIGVGGPMGKDGWLPDPSPAPKGTIAEFLMRHPEFVTRPRLKQGQAYIPRGKKFPLAWWHLPMEAREILRDERKATMAPQAPYWLIAEKGSRAAASVDTGVPPRYYIRNSGAAIERGVPLVAARILGML